jgi:hypothetical protein
MVSKDLCSSIYSAVSQVHGSGEFSKVIFSSPNSATQLEFANIVDEQIEHQIRLQSDIANRAGCGIEFTISGTALRVTCELVNCPAYPNGPESLT